MMTRNLTRCVCVALPILVGSSSANAEIVQYIVEFAQSGTVSLGSTLDWTLSVQVTDSSPGDPGMSIPGNFGIRTAAIDLMNDTGEAMSAATIAAPFADYNLPNGGTPGAGTLTDVGASMILYNAGAVEGADPGNGGNLGPIVLATGSYVVNTLGLHTLSTVASASTSFYYTAPNSASFAAFDSVLFSSDSVTVAAVPEPGSMLLLSTFLGSVVVVRRRRKRRADGVLESSTQSMLHS